MLKEKLNKEIDELNKKIVAIENLTNFINTETKKSNTNLKVAQDALNELNEVVLFEFYFFNMY